MDDSAAAVRETIAARRAIQVARRVTGGRTHLLLVATILALSSGAYFAAYFLRFDFEIPRLYVLYATLSLPIVLLIHLVCFHLFGVFRILWPYVGLKDVFQILRATIAASACLAVVNYLGLQGLVPRGVVVLDGVLTFVGVCGVYGALRFLREIVARTAGQHAAERVFIVGAGDAGEILMRELQRNPSVRAKVVGFIDDASEKQGQSLRGVPILGPIRRATDLARRYKVNRAYIAIPSASGSVLRHIVDELLAAGVSIKILPPLGPGSSSSGFLPRLRDVEVEDLLRREPIKLDNQAISRFLRGKVVLVTGAAGSIGSELCRQILEFGPERLVAVDLAESPLHDLLLELKSSGRVSVVVPELADVTDRRRMEALFCSSGAQVVFHAAALKHVPLLEAHPREAVRVNLAGTRIAAEASRKAAAEAFVLISTDKAVSPTSVMGATKRVAEMLVQQIGAGSPTTRCVAVRFGNVLGSSGSVLPIFKAQLARGGPLTVTHHQMQRYFLTIPEAVQLVLQASVLGRGGETFVLDMGQPVRIVDLAEDLIRLSGLVPGVDVKVEFTGIRPGEKLFEKLWLDSEKVVETPHPQVFCLRTEGPPRMDMEELVRLVQAAADGVPDHEILASLHSLVHDFRPWAPPPSAGNDAVDPAAREPYRSET